MQRPLLRWYTQAIAVALPTIAVFLFEDLRHTWIPHWIPYWLPGQTGNVVAAVVVALASWGYVHLLVGVIARASQQLHRARERVAVLQERSRIAGDIHDNVAQALFLLSHGLAQANAPAHLQELAQKTTQEVRSSIRELRELTRGTLAQDLSALCAEMEARFGLSLNVVIDAGDRSLPASAQEQVVGVVREALTNAAKHSGHPHASLHVTQWPDGCRIVVADRGKGFVPAATDGFGLMLMQERAALAGGQLTLHAQPGEPTRVELWLPEEVFARASPGGG